MIRVFRLSLFILLILSGIGFAGEPLEIGDVAPDWILPNPAGDHISFYEDSQDQSAVLLFWATWCPYCREVMPELESLRQEMAGEDIKFYALNIWEDSDPVAYLQRNNLRFKLMLKADMVAKSYGVQGTPGLMVINPDKSVSYVRLKGTTAADARAAVKAALMRNGAE